MYCPPICHDGAGFTVGDHAATDFGGYFVVAADVVAVVVAHGFLQACAALRGRMRMLAIWGQVRYEVLSEVLCVINS